MGFSVAVDRTRAENDMIGQGHVRASDRESVGGSAIIGHVIENLLEGRFFPFVPYKTVFRERLLK